MILIISYFILGQLFLESDTSGGEYWCEEFTGEWNWIKEDGTKSPIEIPGKYQVERNKKLCVSTTLPKDIPYNSYLCFRSAKQEMNIYVDGVLRKEYSTKNTRLFGKISAVAYVFLELTPEDAEKELILEVQTDSSYSGVFYTVYYGNQIGVWSHLFGIFGAEIIVAFMALALGLVSIFAGVILKRNYQTEMVFDYLGWCVFLAAIWLISNSVFRQLISPNLSVINDMAFLALMILPLPILIYMNGIQKERYKRLYTFSGTLIIVDFVICTVLHMTNSVDYTDTIKYMVIVCSFSLVSIGIGMIIDIRKGYIKEYFWVAIGILASVITAFFQMAMYFQRTITFSGVFLASGLLLLLVFAAVNTIYEILQMEGDRQRAILSSASKGKFLANMSHEIRTPINAVMGMNAMILRESRDRRIKEYAIDIQNAGQSLLSLINDILDFSKMESGKLELIPVDYDFSSMIHDIINMISMRAEAKGLHVELFVDETLPSRLWGDDIRIRQILVNLLNNAVKYTEKGTVTLQVGGEIDNDTVVLKFTVRDTGIGIKEEDIEKLFVDFQRLEENRNRNIEGTGLGMNIAMQLLNMMDSKLQVESTYGQGTVFTFFLAQKIMDGEPIGNLEERIRQQTSEYSYNVSFTAPDAEILVVDDNAVNRRVFMNLLKATKVRIEEACSGQESLERIYEKKYDLIFMDHMMPEMDGVEALHRIKEKTGHFCTSTPIIALTANAIAGAREMYLAEGFDAFVSKPINPEKLEKLLMNMLPKDKIIYEKKNTMDIMGESVKEDVEVDLPDIDGIDWEYALLHMKDINLLKTTIKDYYRMIESEAGELEELHRKIIEEIEGEELQKYIKQYRIKVHSMKSISSMIGAFSLSGVAKMLENAARESRRDIIESVTPPFLELWRSYKVSLKDCISEEKETEEKAEADYDKLIEYLNLLHVSMEDMDIDTADDVMKQIESFHYSNNILDNIQKLGRAVTNLDNEAVDIHIEEIKQQIR